MALTLPELNAYVTNYVVDKTTDTIYKNSPVLTRLQSKNKEQFRGGLLIQRPVIVGELNGDFVGRGNTMDTSFVTTDIALTQDMRVAYVSIVLYGWDSMKDDGPPATFNQVELKFANASMKMAKLLAVNMYLSAQDTGRGLYLNGFSEIYDDGNLYPSYGGQTRADIMAITTPSTVGGLNSYVSTITTFQLSQVQQAYSAAWFGSEHPDLIACTPNAHNLVWQALQPAQRYNLPENSDVGIVGFQGFRFNAADMVVDKYMPTGTSGVMYGLNTDYIEWYFSTNEKFQFGFTGFKEQSNSIDVAGQFLCGSNLVGTNPRTGFKLLSTLF